MKISSASSCPRRSAIAWQFRSIALTVEDVDAAAAKVRSVALAEKGLVLSESISSEPDDVVTGGFSTITIAVPTARLDAALDALAEVGKVHSRTTATDDVTAQYVDTASRVETMKASVERVRALMSKATRLGDIVSLESELSRRQADLEQWANTLAPLSEALRLLLGLLRDSGVPHKAVATHGQYQQSLPAGRSFHLLRLRIDPALGLIPEISGHRLMVSIRLMRQDADGRLRPANDDATFELTLCA